MLASYIYLHLQPLNKNQRKTRTTKPVIFWVFRPKELTCSSLDHGTWPQEVVGRIQAHHPWWPELLRIFQDVGFWWLQLQFTSNIWISPFGKSQAKYRAKVKHVPTRNKEENKKSASLFWIQTFFSRPNQFIWFSWPIHTARTWNAYFVGENGGDRPCVTFTWEVGYITELWRGTIREWWGSKRSPALDKHFQELVAGAGII